MGLLDLMPFLTVLDAVIETRIYRPDGGTGDALTAMFHVCKSRPHREPAEMICPEDSAITEEKLAAISVAEERKFLFNRKLKVHFSLLPPHRYVSNRSE